MKRIIHSGLLKIFSNIETAEDDAKDTVLSGFADELHDYCRREKDLAERTRTLRFAQSELTVAQEHIHTGAGKKCGNTVNYCPAHRVNRLRTGHRSNGIGTPGTVYR